MKTNLVRMAVLVVAAAMMAAPAFAGDHGLNEFGPSDPTALSQPERDLEHLGAGEIRGPMQTGAVPDRSESSYGMHSRMSGDDPTLEIWSRSFRPPAIDAGP